MFPRDAAFLQGYSTWENADIRCPLRTKTERPHTVGLRTPGPLAVTVSVSVDFQTWPGSNSDGILLLVLAWSYMLNEAFAEKLSLPLIAVPPRTLPRLLPASRGTVLHLTYAQPQEYEWWRVLVAPEMSYTFDDPRGLSLPWSLAMEGSEVPVLVGFRPDAPGSLELPSARQAALYLARLCSIYDLGHQSSAALAAVLCSRTYCRSGSTVLRLPRPRLSAPRPASCVSQFQTLPREFKRLSYYMTLGLFNYAVPVLLENIFWDSRVSLQPRRLMDAPHSKHPRWDRCAWR